MAAVAAAALCPALLTGASAAAARGPAAAGGRLSAAGGSWGRAEKVPGLAALNKGNAGLDSVSCGSAGSCSAAGSYTDGSGHSQPFVVSQHKGRWGRAEKVRSLAALRAGGGASIYLVSCGSAGSCSAAGSYTDGSGHSQPFVVSQHKGRWGRAEKVPGLAALSAGRNAEIDSVSCASAGSCSAGGLYATRSSGRTNTSYQAFVVSQHKGSWGRAEKVPGLAALNTGGRATIYSVSCASAGSCSAGGYYADASGSTPAFVVSQHNGSWGRARKVPGLAALNAEGFAEIDSVSCASAGSCSAGGFYTDDSGRYQVFVVSQHNGSWGRARKVPGAAVLNTGGSALINSVSCASAGNCSAGGLYTAGSGPKGNTRTQAFVVSQHNGSWGRARKVPALAALNTRGDAVLYEVSCGAAGSCSAGGFYTDGSGHGQAFVVSQHNGTWNHAEKVPGTAALNAGGDAVTSSVSCASAGNCSAIGSYKDGSGHHQAFIAIQAR